MTVMRIAFFSDSFYPHVDGVTSYIRVVTEALIAKGHEVLIVAPKRAEATLLATQRFAPGAKVLLAPGVKMFFYPDFCFGAPSPKVLFAVRKFTPDVIHFHTPTFLGMQAIMMAKVLKVPLITTFHTYYMEPEGFVAIGIKSTGKVAELLQESLWKVSEQIHNPCDVVVAPTEYVGKDLKKRWKKVEVEVIPGAVELSPFGNQSNREMLRTKYKLGKGVVFLSVGRLSPEKNHETIMTSFAMILMKHPDAKLVFVGDGLGRKDLEYLAGVLGIRDSVVFVGNVPYQTLTKQNYYAMGDVFVTASTWDTQGLSVVEAMAAGLPVVALKYRAMPEVVGRGGILASFGDPRSFARAMSELAGKKQLMQRLGACAQSEAQKYKIDTHVERLEKLYARLILAKKLEQDGK